MLLVVCMFSFYRLTLERIYVHVFRQRWCDATEGDQSTWGLHEFRTALVYRIHAAEDNRL